MFQGPQLGGGGGFNLVWKWVTCRFWMKILSKKAWWWDEQVCHHNQTHKGKKETNLDITQETLLQNTEYRMIVFCYFHTQHKVIHLWIKMLVFGPEHPEGDTFMWECPPLWPLQGIRITIPVSSAFTKHNKLYLYSWTPLYSQPLNTDTSL